MKISLTHRLAFTCSAVLLLSMGLGGVARAGSVTLTATGLNADINGNIVTATTVITSSPASTASYAGVCARSSSGAKRDFPFQSNIWLTPSGSQMSSYQPLPTGTYSYWSCAKVNGVWYDIGSKQTLVVSPDAPPTQPVAMPVGNLPHFQQEFTDDFTTNLAEGSFPGSYVNKWTSYNGFPDSRNKGDYNQGIISMHDGMMDLDTKVVNGRVQGAAPTPLLNGARGGQVYGKYTVRFKADSMIGVSAAWLLWPDSNEWNDGEIDFPEGAFNGPFWAFNHCIGNPSVNCDYLNTQTNYSNWHTTSVEWTPASVKFILDGVTLLTSTSNVPRTAMHWVLQTESNADTATVGGHVYIDWVAMYKYVG